jgi:hypothetical protein
MLTCTQRELYHIIITRVVTFFQGIHKTISETKHVSRVLSVPAVLYLQFVLQVMLFRWLNMFCTFTFVISEAWVQCPI